jgi:2-amino-4-hydroxy-6-hydroxymethyldihydropteridine diphosphokinase
MAAMPGEFRAWIALGANLASPAGDCEATLRSAVRALEHLGKVTAVSSVWETQPVGLADQPLFLNAAAALETTLGAPELLQQLLQMELAHGRDRSSGLRNGPRTLDLDLLLMESADGPVIVLAPGLELPHPQMHRRRFVLAPLAEIAPEIVHPLLQKTIAAILRELDSSGDNAAENVRRLHPLVRDSQL